MSEEQQNDEQIKALYDEASVDISLPDIPMPEPEPEKETEVKDELDGAFNFAFIGAGQGGSRLAESFSKLGYRKLAVLNTAQQDLNTIKLVSNKLCIGDGGAGKNPDVAEKLFVDRKEDVFDISDRFVILDRGEVVHQLNKDEVSSPEKLIKIMKDTVSKH